MAPISSMEGAVFKFTGCGYHPFGEPCYKKGLVRQCKKRFNFLWLQLKVANGQLSHIP